MFKARGTRVLNLPAAAPPRTQPSALLSEGTPDAGVLGPSNTPAAGDTVSVPAAVEAPGLPALPPDFLEHVKAAQRGDPDALAMMHEIGRSVPAELRVAFVAYVEDLIAD